MTDQELVDQLGAEWASLARLGGQLSEAEWKTPTALPGWSVQDNLTHITAFEWRLLDRPDPDHALPADLPHLRNDIGRSNEVFVDSRRALSGADALAEFQEVTAARLAMLRALDDAGFSADSWTPLGPGTVRDLLPFRVFDAWVHEQDMRAAVRRPGHLDGPIAAAARDRMLATVPYVVAKKVGAPDGTTVVVELAEPLPARLGVVVEGRARPVDPPPDDPSVRIRTDGETFVQLTCGRCDPAAALDAGRVTVEGDEALGRRVVEALNTMF